MIDFENGSFFKLAPIDVSNLPNQVDKFLLDGEEVVSAFKTIRDSVIFTNLRVIAVNVQGLTGKKVDYTSLPYSKVQAFSIETSGSFDWDCELDLFFAGDIGKVRFEFKSGFDIVQFNRLLSSFIL